MEKTDYSRFTTKCCVLNESEGQRLPPHPPSVTTPSSRTSVLGGWSPFQTLRSVVNGGATGPPVAPSNVVLLGKRHIEVEESVVPVGDYPPLTPTPNPPAPPSASPPPATTLERGAGGVGGGGVHPLPLIHDPLNYHPHQKHLHHHHHHHLQQQVQQQQVQQQQQQQQQLQLQQQMQYQQQLQQQQQQQQQLYSAPDAATAAAAAAAASGFSSVPSCDWSVEQVCS
ncbi:hypothetical protein FHG87_025804 [Trinorchestia longiramus]|nr:hypothetical protein FHG87_025804 [Trinorchestia longiramus]